MDSVLNAGLNAVQNPTLNLLCDGCEENRLNSFCEAEPLEVVEFLRPVECKCNRLYSADMLRTGELHRDRRRRISSIATERTRLTENVEVGQVF